MRQANGKKGKALQIGSGWLQFWSAEVGIGSHNRGRSVTYVDAVASMKLKVGTSQHMSVRNVDPLVLSLWHLLLGLGPAVAIVEKNATQLGCIRMATRRRPFQVIFDPRGFGPGTVMGLASSNRHG